MWKWIAKPFLWLVTSAIPVFIAACYGPGYTPEEEGDLLEGTARNGNGAGIPDIKVSCVKDDGFSVDSTYTNGPDGYFSIRSRYSEPCAKLRFADVDGSENGAYDEMDVTITSPDDSIDVVLVSQE